MELKLSMICLAVKAVQEVWDTPLSWLTKPLVLSLLLMFCVGAVRNREVFLPLKKVYTVPCLIKVPKKNILSLKLFEIIVFSTETVNPLKCKSLEFVQR